MDIHAADRRHRRRLLLWLAAFVLVATVFLARLSGWLDALVLDLEGRDPATVRRWVGGLLAALGVLLAVPPLSLGRSLRRMGRLAVAEARFPPAGWKTLRDVRVLRGEDARRWGRRVERAGSLCHWIGGALLGAALLAWLRFG